MSSIRIGLIRAQNRVATLGRARHPRIFVNSIPKTGTNLVVSLAKAYGRLAISGPIIQPDISASDLARRDGLVFGHFETLPSDFGKAEFDDGFLLVRHPASYVDSLARYIQVNKRHPAHGLSDGRSATELATCLIDGIETAGFSIEAIDKRYSRYVSEAARVGLKFVDFDDFKPDRLSESAAALLRWIGGEDYREDLAARFEESRGLSSTFAHSRRSTLKVDLTEAMRAKPSYRNALALYERHLFR